MPRNTNTGDRRGPIRVAAVAAVLLLMASVAAIVMGVIGTEGPPQPAASAPMAPVTPHPGPVSGTPGTQTPNVTRKATPKPRGLEALKPQVATQPKIGPFLAASKPTVLDIPSIGVHATDFVDLRVAADGSLGVPGSTDEVGFYRDGPTPGQLGTAILGAHVDSKKGPGIFYRLGAVKAGSRVQITRADKSLTSFVVDKVQAFPKDQFPDDVYTGDFSRAEIRLITCGGTFDNSTHHYRDNIVVFAHLVGS
jgi:Sortase domain